MGGFKKFFDNIVLKSSLVATGVSFMFLYKRRVYPEVTAPLFYVFTTVGCMAVMAHLIKEKEGDEKSEDPPADSNDGDNSSDEDPEFEARMAEFQRMKPHLEEKLRENERLMREVQVLMLMRARQDKWINVSLLLDIRIRNQERRWQQYQPRGRRLSGVKSVDLGDYMKSKEPKAEIEKVVRPSTSCGYYDA